MVVHRPLLTGGRQVSVRGEGVVVARSLADVLAVVRRIGILLEYEDAGGTALIEWRGGGADVWDPSR
ncbi:hypothetical protein ACIRPX_13735 [Streptomyces sp. NPDC101225]|uniref:hypothetical protein n=1 Tax=Streptomyces sp. NPDC101225 TaxID=3366135 RepID=UPI00380D6227